MENEREKKLAEAGLTPEQIAAVLDTESKEEEDAKILAMPQKPTQVTSISELKKYSGGEIVELPGFTDDAPFVARLRRPSLLILMKSGKIPNSLLSQAQELFSNGTANAGDQTEQDFSKMIDVVEILCKSAFVEPSYEELEQNDIQLTDEQMMAVFSYTQRGIKALESFRRE